MVFGDNVRARMAARALPRTPAQEEQGRQGEDKGKTGNETTRTIRHRHSTTHNTVRQDKTRTATTT